MIIYFGKKYEKNAVPFLEINGHRIERVESFKLLGVQFTANLRWDQHVSYVLNRVSKRYYIIFQLVRMGVNHMDIVCVYISLIRSVVEYACAVWHTNLTVSQSADIERVQKRCLRIIYPHLSYSESLNISGLERLSVRREAIVRKLFQEMQHNDHILNGLLPYKQGHAFPSRDSYPLLLPLGKTNRFLSSFVPYCIRKRY
jgi:hypothetical protein